MKPNKYQLLFGLCTLAFLCIFSIESFGQNAPAKKVFNILNYGAVPDGKTINTKAIQTTIDEANKNGGGKVIFPKGKFLTGSIEMKSNVSIYLEGGAVLLGSTNPNDYKVIDMKGRPVSPKTDDNSQLALILCHNANNISLSGKGLIDGQGRELALNTDSLIYSGLLVDKRYDKVNRRPSETVRPKLFRFSECHQVKISNLEIQNAACWGLSFELCSQLTINNISLINRAYWNNDGMDITDCRNVRITNCNINSADDGICLKSYYPGYSNDSIYIANCTIRSSASAIKFGTASYGGFKNVTIENIKIFDTFRSALALECVDGGTIENINIHNITAVNTGNAIFIRLGNRAGEVPGIVRNIHIKDVKVQVPFGRPDINYDMRGPEVDFFHNAFPSSITGLTGHDVENIILENIQISYPGRASKGMAYIPLGRLDQIPEKEKSYPEFSMFGELPAWGFYLRHASGITFKNIKLTLDNKDFRPAFIFDDVKDLKMDLVKIPDPEMQQIILYKTNDEHLDKNLKSSVKIL
jgi:polygalacturonase